MFSLMYQAEPSSTELDPGASVEPVQEEVTQSGNVGRKRSCRGRYIYRCCYINIMISLSDVLNVQHVGTF